MTLVAIRELTSGLDQQTIDVSTSFDHGPEYRATVASPFSIEDDVRLEWYFEQHLQSPFTDIVKAREAARSITAYGESLFNQVFADPQSFAEYSRHLQGGLSSLIFEIAGSPDFHQMHWEALKDPSLPLPFALNALVVRKNLTPQAIPAIEHSVPVVRVLLVTARPRGARDVGYRTISRPLVNILRQASLRVEVDIVRPGTYRALVNHVRESIDRHGPGYYQVVHFDCHGALLTHKEWLAGVANHAYRNEPRYGRTPVTPFEGYRAFLMLEGDRDQEADPVEASELADMLVGSQIPIAILNACQSGKQFGASETSLGSRLMQAGAQLVLAMRYSITVSAAETLMKTLYKHLFAGDELATAVRRGRLELHDQKARRAFFNQTIDLEDWLLPVVYENRHTSLQTREPTLEEAEEFYLRQAGSYRPSEPLFGFVGRDLDVLRLEKLLLGGTETENPNIVLIRGMGGAGKTALLNHLGVWWQATGLVQKVFYFGYDKHAWTMQQVLTEVAQVLLGDQRYWAEFEPLSADAKTSFVTERLRATRHLLLLDNFESISGGPEVGRNPLPKEERARLARFLLGLYGGHTLVILGSRGRESWLAEGQLQILDYQLGGLDEEAASALADKVMVAHNATPHRDSPDLKRVLELLCGYPIAITVVLANVGRQTPSQVLEALEAGDVRLDDAAARSQKARSILQCVAYSMGNLSPDARTLLVALAPFGSRLFAPMLSTDFAQALAHQPEWSVKNSDRWDELVTEATNWGLLQPETQAPGWVQIHPLLPYFLRGRLSEPGMEPTRTAIENAFFELYDSYSHQMVLLMRSTDPEEHLRGRASVQIEYENLVSAVNIGLKFRKAIASPYLALVRFLDEVHDSAGALELSRRVRATIATFPSELMAGRNGVDLVVVLQNLGGQYRRVRDFAAAIAAYDEALTVLDAVTALPKETADYTRGEIYQNLSVIAVQLQKWDFAKASASKALEIWKSAGDVTNEGLAYEVFGHISRGQGADAEAQRHYDQALQIFNALKDEQRMAEIYTELAQLATDRHDWPNARDYCLKALDIHERFHNRHGQASMLVLLATAIAREGKDLPRAAAYFREAFGVFLTLDDKHAQGVIDINLSQLAMQQSDWPEAEQHALKGLETFEALSDTLSVAKASFHLGQLHILRQDEMGAIQWLERALRKATDVGDPSLMARAVAEIAGLHRRSGQGHLIDLVGNITGMTSTQVADLFERYQTGTSEASIVESFTTDSPGSALNPK